MISLVGDGDVGLRSCMGKDIIAFRNLPEEHREEVVKHCIWQTIPEVKLA